MGVIGRVGPIGSDRACVQPTGVRGEHRDMLVVFGLIVPIGCVSVVSLLVMTGAQASETVMLCPVHGAWLSVLLLNMHQRAPFHTATPLFLFLREERKEEIHV